MAAVVTTVTIVRKSVWGDRRAVSATLDFDTGDYAAGGIAVTAGQFGLQVLDSLIFEGAVLDVAATPTALVPRYSHTSQKIEMYQANGSAVGAASLVEHAAAAMGSGAKCHVIAIGY